MGGSGDGGGLGFGCFSPQNRCCSFRLGILGSKGVLLGMGVERSSGCQKKKRFLFLVFFWVVFFGWDLEFGFSFLAVGFVLLGGRFGFWMGGFIETNCLWIQ